ncbi:MAG: hypothetical protein ACR2RF_26070 [Geminicoccaceae bacterium]
MSIKDAWAQSIPLRVLLTFMTTVGAAAVIGMVTLIGDVRENTAVVQSMRAEIVQLRQDFGERLRYLERARRGLPPGEP